MGLPSTNTTHHANAHLIPTSIAPTITAPAVHSIVTDATLMETVPVATTTLITDNSLEPDVSLFPAIIKLTLPSQEHASTTA